MFDVFYSGTKPNLFAHEQAVDTIEQAQQQSRTRFFWFVNYLSDYIDFDFLWEPVPWQSHQRHAWPSQWQRDSGTYLVPKVGYTETNYRVGPVVPRLSNSVNWTIDSNFVNWDTSWHPDPNEPDFVHEFATTWWDQGGPVYAVPGAATIKYHAYPKAELSELHHNRVQMLTNCGWDYTWQPHPKDPPYIYVFGNQWWPAEVFPTVRYTVPGATEVKYMVHPTAKLPSNIIHWITTTELPFTFDYSWQPDPGDLPYIYVFGNQWHTAEIMPTVEYRMPGATERKYVDTPVAKLLVDMKLWHVPDNVDITDMDFSWVPDPGSPPYIYQFATQHQKTGGPQYCMPGATEIKYVDMMQAEVTAESVSIVEIDHLDGNAGLIPNIFKHIRYFDNYRDTLIRLAKSLVGKHEHVWVCSSICDYTDFDFSWHPEKWQSTMLHVFPSNSQKFGDTFYMHVPTFAERAEKKQLLEWYSVNYVSRRPVPRRPMPVIEHHNDSHVDAVKSSSWAGPLATFTNTDYVTGDLVTVPLWRTETKTIVPLSPGASSVVVPRAAVGHIQTQLYDYPYIDRTHRLLKDDPLDIVFISNGETITNETFAHLQNVTGNLFREQRIHHVKGINGRVAAYHAAAEASSTPWFFAVFAKLFVDEKFNWDWQPDRMQQPKHYIFHALNPVNGLVYGHQAMIAYNRQLVLNNPGHGLDFTLDNAHEVVPILSGTAVYNMSPWVAWRTAFREALKLKTSLPDVENEFRLNQWLSTNPGSQHIVNEEWSRWGAEDAVEYYNEVDGDFAALRKSYEWSWLASYAFIKRSLVPD